jgi:hypothetical protein
MMFAILAILIGAALGYWISKSLEELLLLVGYSLKFWNKSNFYLIYRLIAEGEPIPGLTKRRPSRRSHSKAFHNGTLDESYNNFRKQQFSMLRTWAEISALYLVLPAVAFLLLGQIWWLLGSYALASLAYLKLFSSAEAAALMPQLLDRHLAEDAYCRAGLRIKEDDAPEPLSSISQIRAWRLYKWFLAALDAAALTILLIVALSDGDIKGMVIMLILFQIIVMLPLYLLPRRLATNHLAKLTEN